MTISERLRDRAARMATKGNADALNDAADEIDRLIAENAALREERDALAAQVGALRDALEIANNGLNWYRDRHPESVSGCDYEADEQIAMALSATDPAAIIAARDAQTRKAERERCAKVCDEMFAGQFGAVHVASACCAAAIRALED